MEQDFNNKSFKDRIEDINNNLYLGGGFDQANALINIMLSPFSQKEFTGNSDIDVSGVLISIGNQIKELKRIIKDGGIVPFNVFMNSFKHMHRLCNAYACLDKDLKFCVKHFGEGDWKDILYVFPYMNSTTAYDVTFKKDIIHTSYN